jgi:hypothetical protein
VRSDQARIISGSPAEAARGVQAKVAAGRQNASLIMTNAVRPLFAPGGHKNDNQAMKSCPVGRHLLNLINLKRLPFRWVPNHYCVRHVLFRVFLSGGFGMSGVEAAAQVQRYAIYVSGEVVGQLTATESTYLGRGSVINIDSRMTIRFLGSFVIESHQASFYRRSVLREAEAEVRRDGQLRERCLTEQAGNGYRVTLKGENLLAVPGQITWTVGQLYLHEPKGVQQVYSERLGQFCPVRGLSPGVYEVELPNGSRNHYSYQQGVCQRMETTTNLKDVRFERLR